MLEDLALELKRLAGVDPHALADDETIATLHRMKSQVEAITARATAAWEARRGFADEHRTAAAWLAAQLHVPKGEASRMLRLGRACRVLPVAEDAWLAGEITGDHVGLLASKRTDRTVEAMARDELELVHRAQRMSYRCFTREVRYWEQRNDPDGVERQAQRVFDARCVHLSETFEAWRLDGWLDPIGGSIVANVLAGIYDELVRVDWAEATARLGEGNVTAADLGRTPAQRRADALVEMATRAATAPKDGRRPAPLFTVLVGYETFAGRVCELAGGAVVTPGSLAPWLTEADVERVVFAGPSRVLDVSTKNRFFTGAARRAVEVRDRLACFVDGCDERAEHVDHVLPFALDGPTTVDNGRMACRYHNLLRNRRPQGP